MSKRLAAKSHRGRSVYGFLTSGYFPLHGGRWLFYLVRKVQSLPPTRKPGLIFSRISGREAMPDVQVSTKGHRRLVEWVISSRPVKKARNPLSRRSGRTCRWLICARPPSLTLPHKGRGDLEALGIFQVVRTVFSSRTGDALGSPALLQ